MSELPIPQSVTPSASGKAGGGARQSTTVRRTSGAGGSICCAPFLPWAGIWKRCQMFTANCSEWRASDVVGRPPLIYDCFFIAVDRSRRHRRA
jgi:hypothetical protein